LVYMCFCYCIYNSERPRWRPFCSAFVRLVFS
jgi:hypothetical protein